MDPRTWFKDLTPYFLYLILVSTIGPLLFGFHLAELNAPESVITCEKRSIRTSAEPSLPQCIEMNSVQIGLVSSIFTLGGLIGALGVGPLSARYGRLPSMRYTTIPFTIGPIFEAAAPNIGTMALGRFISGLGAGASVVVVPIYISEIAPPAEKGFFGALTQVMVNMGILITQLLGYFLSHDSMWRIILGVGGLIGILQAAGLVFGEESPKWMADRGQVTKAKRILRHIRGNAFDVEDEFSSWGPHASDDGDDEEETLLHNESGDQNKSSEKRILGFFEVARHPDTKKAVISIVMIMLAQQLCGINSIIMYGVKLLSGLLEANSALLNLIVSALNIIVTAGCAPLVDKLGRKFCLLSSIFGMGTSSLLLAFGILNEIKILSAVAVLLFVSSFALGLGPVPFLLSSELVSPDAVSATQSWALAANWIATFAVAQFFPIANAKLHGKVYFVFAGLAAFFWLFIGWFVPETKGKKTADEVWGRERRED
ncbi:vacuolar protein sorting-associated protein 73 [Patellaria atrata CBS 101060]|uniref:Vacuolar protein sorting-associated protein 73 n=1 Tax=Patellaria atrata CBS 101060 TaxID=1346257 RepID=A0A9P4SB10_9PEZI|nr:vacuolar protein sorting-associated protein 73 [Patellaria atrata CBS 101060]